MSEKVPFAIAGDKKPRLNIAKLGEVSIGAGMAAVLIWGIVENNIEQSLNLQTSYLDLLREHNAMLIESDKKYQRTITEDIDTVVHNLDEVVKMMQNMQDMQTEMSIMNRRNFRVSHEEN